MSAAGALLSAGALKCFDLNLGRPHLSGLWLVLAVAGGGAALAGLAVASAGGTWVRVAMSIGLTLGFVFNGKLSQLATTRGWPLYLFALITWALAMVAAIVARQHLPQPESRPGAGALLVAAVSGVAVMGALLLRSRQVNDFEPVRALSELPDADTVKYSLLAVSALVALLFALYAAKLGGPKLAYLPVLGFGLAAPMTPVALGFSSVAPATWGIVGGGIVLSTVIGAFAMVSYDLPWEVAGVLAAGGGLLMIANSGGGTAHGAYLLMVCGGSFALAAGLVRAAGLPIAAPAAGLGVVLMMATMMLAAQALGPATLDALGLNLLVNASRHAVLPSALAAVVLLLLFVLDRSARSRRA